MQQIKITYQDLVETKRLVIPGRVAREFAKNRAEKLKTIYQQVSRKRDAAISRAAYPLLESSEEYQKLIEIEKELDSKLSNYRKQVAVLLDEIRSWYWNDPVSSLYRQLFGDQVVVDIAHDEDKLRLDLENRQLHKIPPGFQDSAKDDQGIGDLLVWLTILELGQTRKQDIIFVTGDSKNDWRYQSENQALYPRFELIEEYRRSSDGKTIHIVNFSEFLQLFGASQRVVDEVRQEEVLGDIQEARRVDESLSKAAVKEWIRANYPDSSVHDYIDAPLDFVVRTSDSERVGIVVKTLLTRGGLLSIIRLFISRVQDVLQQSRIHKLICVFVADEKIVRTLDLFSEFMNFLPPGLSILVGTVSPNGTFFVPLLRIDSTKDGEIEIDEDPLPF